MDEILVRKLDVSRCETWRYSGRVIRRESNAVLLEAYFNRDDLPFHGIVLGRGDRFIEQFFTDRWYNIFEIHDRSDGHLKGWYCNVCLPAELDDHQVAYVDLALDLLVFPSGQQLILDEDEFAMLQIDDDTRLTARQALVELQQLMASPGILGG
jgi:predicted RNA-binding protein associated with RNAse of E/G family